MPHDPGADAVDQRPDAPLADHAHLPVALTVAGSDSGGGAGIQADLKTFEARDVFGTSAITAVTAQNTTGVTATESLDPATIQDQIRTVCDDFPVDAAKTGMLATTDIVEAVADEVDDRASDPADILPLVVDPVIVAESGDPLLAGDAIETLRDRLVPQATLVTPNADEATLLTDVAVQDAADAERAARELVEMGADAALVTGGHLDGDPVDVLVSGDTNADGGGLETRRFAHDRIATEATHGSGCTLSAAVTAELARSASLPDAVETAIEFVTRAIRFGYDYGDGAGPVHHFAETRTRTGLTQTRRAVELAVAELEAPAFAPLVPEVGMQIAAAPRFATAPKEVVAVDGRLHRTATGVRTTGGVRSGVSSHVARFLLGVREYAPDVGAACNVRHSTEVGEVVRDAWDVKTIDRANEPADAPGTMDWAARRAISRRERGPGSAPDAVLDDGAVGKEAMVRVLAESVDGLVEKLRVLSESLELDADVVEPLVVDGEVDEERRE